LELLQTENLYSESSSSRRRMKQEIHLFSWKVWNFFSYLVQVYHLVWCRETVTACLLCLCSTLLWWSQKRMQCLWKARILRGLSFASCGTLSKGRHSKRKKQEQNWRSFKILLASVFLVRMMVNLPHKLWRLSILCPVCSITSFLDSWAHGIDIMESLNIHFWQVPYLCSLFVDEQLL
jgi:hypothetical protein